MTTEDTTARDNSALPFDGWGDLTPPYGTIVADPPWAYRTTRGITSRTGFGTSCAEDHYSTMTNQSLARLPVSALAADDAHLYMWVTNPKLYTSSRSTGPNPAEIMEAWGFKYVTMLTWVKTGSLGMGFYFRGDTEHVLFGVRGNCPIPAEKRVRNVFTAAKRGHSRKPEHLMEIVERVSPSPRLELFARAPRLGWDSWGRGFETGATEASA